MIIIILEPRISGLEADTAYARIGRMSWVRAEANGFSREIWVLWNKDEIKVRIRFVEKCFVHLVLCPSIEIPWEFMTAHTSPNLSLRRGFWSELDMIEV